jgi:hypothetical protein
MSAKFQSPENNFERTVYILYHENKLDIILENRKLNRTTVASNNGGDRQDHVRCTRNSRHWMVSAPIVVQKHSLETTCLVLRSAVKV